MRASVVTVARGTSALQSGRTHQNGTATAVRVTVERRNDLIRRTGLTMTAAQEISALQSGQPHRDRTATVGQEMPERRNARTQSRAAETSWSVGSP